MNVDNDINPTRTALHVKSTPVRTTPLTTAEKYIFQLQSPNSTLRSISLAGNDITDENVEAFAAALLGNRSVSYLAMFCIRGGDTPKGATLLAASAMSLSSLRTLSWSNMFEGGYAIQILSQGLKKSKTLNRVLLMDSKLKNNDIAMLANALEENTSIDTMGLECCGITDRGAAVLSKMVKKNRALRTLSLGENGITDVGAEALLGSIFDTRDFNSIWMSNHTITSFSRESTFHAGESVEQFCHVSPDMNAKISRILEINRSSRDPAEIGRHKIALHLEEGFNSSWIEELDEKLMPHLLSWCGRTGSFEILRNMPDLLASYTQQTAAFLLPNEASNNKNTGAEAVCSNTKVQSTHIPKSKKFIRRMHLLPEKKQAQSAELQDHGRCYPSGSAKGGHTNTGISRMVSVGKAMSRLRKANGKSKSKRRVFICKKD